MPNRIMGRVMQAIAKPSCFCLARFGLCGFDNWRLTIMKNCTIRVIATGEVLTVKSYGQMAWDETCKGNFYHRTAAELVNPKGDM
jgi:hypothetical protein